jgi:hypothetical protein
MPVLVPLMKRRSKMAAVDYTIIWAMISNWLLFIVWEKKSWVNMLLKIVFLGSAIVASLAVFYRFHPLS